VREDISQRAAAQTADGDWGGNEVGDMDGTTPRRSSARGSTHAGSPLVLMSLVAPLVGGPVGSVFAIVFGWAAHQEPLENSSPRRRGLAVVGMGLGLVFTCLWAAVMAHVAMSLEKDMRAMNEASVVEAEQSVPTAALATSTSMPDGGRNDPVSFVPRATTVHREGLVVVVDIGTSVPSLSEEVAKERAEASRVGDVMVVMTTRGECSSCRHFSNALRHPLMQTALAHVRLVRIDVDVFEEDLSSLKIPHENLPGFFLLAPDLYPRDGIDGGEWGADLVMNVAPVVGAFVNGKYVTRRRVWQSVSENRLRL
jgi:hypothetical protein